MKFPQKLAIYYSCCCHAIRAHKRFVVNQDKLLEKQRPKNASVSFVLGNFGGRKVMTEVKDRNVSIYDLNIPIVLDHLKKAAGELIQKKSLTPFARNSAKTQ